MKIEQSPTSPALLSLYELTSGQVYVFRDSGKDVYVLAISGYNGNTINTVSLETGRIAGPSSGKHYQPVNAKVIIQ